MITPDDFPCEGCYHQPAPLSTYCTRHGKELSFWDDVRIAIFGCPDESKE